MEKRPEILTTAIDPETFKKFYWDKKELVAFCSAHGLPSSGGKIELTDRIELFLKTGKIPAPKIEAKRQGSWDSERQITRSTRVVNYKNDASTRIFFEKEIGKNFRFNAYLRQFAKSNNAASGLTYGDLVDGWIKAEIEKQNSKTKKAIDPQFQFNQFQRDFYAAEKGKSRDKMVAAWNLVRSAPGEATYEHYLQLMAKRNPN